MNPLLILAWVGTIALCLVITVLAVVSVVAMIRSIRKPKSEATVTSILSKEKK